MSAAGLLLPQSLSSLRPAPAAAPGTSHTGRRAALLLGGSLWLLVLLPKSSASTWMRSPWPGLDGGNWLGLLLARPPKLLTMLPLAPVRSPPDRRGFLRVAVAFCICICCCCCCSCAGRPVQGKDTSCSHGELLHEAVCW
jgi:hypothetical protein